MLTTVRLEHMVAARFQGAHEGLSHTRFVVDDEDGFGTTKGLGCHNL